MSMNSSPEVSSTWRQAVSEYLAVAEVSSKEKSWMTQMKTTSSVVSHAIKTANLGTSGFSSSESLSQQLFLAAVTSAGTHDVAATVDQGAIRLKVDDLPPVIGNQVATLLRYADAIDKFLESVGNVTFAGAFVFGAVRVLLTAAVKEITLLSTIKDKFDDLNHRLCRLDVYLALQNPTDAVKNMCIHVLQHILRFCALATKYFKSIPPYLRNTDGLRVPVLEFTAAKESNGSCDSKLGQ
jgi:hypothetical protein